MDRYSQKEYWESDRFGCRCTPRSTNPNKSFSSIFSPTTFDNNVLPNVNANSDPQVLPTKLPINPPLNPNAMAAAVSTTEVGRPQHSQNMNPTAYRNRPLFPLEAMSLSVCMIAVRNFSRSKKAWILSQCRKEKVAMAMTDVVCTNDDGRCNLCFWVAALLGSEMDDAADDALVGHRSMPMMSSRACCVAFRPAMVNRNECNGSCFFLFTYL
eukprot:scaffold11313_cov144-Skeletonema_marinoi.AAC.3